MEEYRGNVSNASNASKQKRLSSETIETPIYIGAGNRNNRNLAHLRTFAPQHQLTTNDHVILPERVRDIDIIRKGSEGRIDNSFQESGEL
jgi:hypothetical protein